MEKRKEDSMRRQYIIPHIHFAGSMKNSHNHPAYYTERVICELTEEQYHHLLGMIEDEDDFKPILVYSKKLNKCIMFAFKKRVINGISFLGYYYNYYSWDIESINVSHFKNIVCKVFIDQISLEDIREWKTQSI